jgi:hypothetical protein
MNEQLELPLSYAFRQMEAMSDKPARLEPCNVCNPSLWVAFCEYRGRHIDLSTPCVWTELDVYLWARLQIRNIEGDNG